MLTLAAFAFAMLTGSLGAYPGGSSACTAQMVPQDSVGGPGMAPQDSAGGPGMAPQDSVGGPGMAPQDSVGGPGMGPQDSVGGPGMTAAAASCGANNGHAGPQRITIY